VIDRVDVLVLSHRLSTTRFFSTGSNVTRDSVVVRVRERGGVVGWGETYLVPGVVAAARALGGMLVGARAADAVGMLSRLDDAHRWALGAVSMALDDLQGKLERVPLSALYGAPCRERVAAYASSRGYVQDVALLEAWAAEAEIVRGAGFRAMKLRIGRMPLAHELPAIEAVHRAVPALEWMADGNGAYDFDEALELGRALESLGFRWLEEPLPTGDYPAYRPLADVLAMPVAGGETLETPDDARTALDAGAFDIIQPDLGICGGMQPLLEIAQSARDRGRACVPHSCNGGILLAATLQALALLPDTAGLPRWAEPMLEVDVGENPLRVDLLREPPVVSDGCIAIPDGPGLGVDIDESIVERYLVAD
jgi:D-galactarolactone cycloisomerase